MDKNKNRIKNIINRYYKVIKAKYKIDYMLLYGSYANGKANKYSDIDLAIILDEFKENYLEIIEFLSLARKYAKSIDIEPVVYSTKEYKNTEKGTFLDEIKRTGKLIFKNGKFLF